MHSILCTVTLKMSLQTVAAQLKTWNILDIVSHENYITYFINVSFNYINKQK